MTDENKQPDDVAEGFDLPDIELTPPPEDKSPGGAEGFNLPDDEPAGQTDEEPGLFEPHVKQAEKPASVRGKLIALTAVPVVAILVIIGINTGRQKPWLAYKQECAAVAKEFLKGLSDDTEKSVPAAYNLLHRDLRRRLATETVVNEYAEATKGLGKFKGLGSVRWDEGGPGVALRSFRSLAQFEGGGQSPVRFRFARVTVKQKDGKKVTEVKISAYKFGAK